MTEESKPVEDRHEEEMRHDENKTGRTGPGTDVSAPGGPTAPATAARTGTGGTGEILPRKAAEDDARSWGDRDEDHDTWLKEQKPPHWG